MHTHLNSVHMYALYLSKCQTVGGCQCWMLMCSILIIKHQFDFFVFRWECVCCYIRGGWELSTKRLFTFFFVGEIASKEWRIKTKWKLYHSEGAEKCGTGWNWRWRYAGQDNIVTIPWLFVQPWLVVSTYTHTLTLIHHLFLYISNKHNVSMNMHFLVTLIQIIDWNVQLTSIRENHTSRMGLRMPSHPPPLSAHAELKWKSLFHRTYLTIKRNPTS